ncbi:hypothetical protein ABZ568_41625, partial [Streptomyces olindensis]
RRVRARRGCRRRPAAAGTRPVVVRKGPCRGVSARSGWRVNEQSVGTQVDRAVPRTETPGAAPPTTGE